MTADGPTGVVVAHLPSVKGGELTERPCCEGAGPDRRQTAEPANLDRAEFTSPAGDWQHKKEVAHEGMATQYCGAVVYFCIAAGHQATGSDESVIETDS